MQEFKLMIFLSGGKINIFTLLHKEGRFGKEGAQNPQGDYPT